MPGDQIHLMATPTDDKLKVLVVDDDELNRRMMRLILSRENHQVKIASSGFEALDAAQSEEFDIILMDLQMPEMDGVETSRKIRAIESNGRHAYIVALTASYLPEKGHELFQAGIDNYIAKPFDVEHLRQMLKHGLDHRQNNSTHGGVSPAELPVLNTTMGIKRVGGDDASYKDLLSDFVKQLPDKVMILEESLTERDMETLSRFAHNIKGVSANLGALQLSKYAGRLEKLTGEGYTDLLEGVFKEFKDSTQKLMQVAPNFLAGQGK